MGALQACLRCRVINRSLGKGSPVPGNPNYCTWIGRMWISREFWNMSRKTRTMFGRRFYYRCRFSTKSQNSFIFQALYIYRLRTVKSYYTFTAFNLRGDPIVDVDHDIPETSKFKNRIDALNFCSCRTWPDVAATVGILCHFVSGLTIVVLLAATRLSVHLWDKYDYKLFVSFSRETCTLYYYCVSDCGGDESDEKSN